MSDRADIEPNKHGWRRLSYTTQCGWVDWGHALPGGARKLKRQLDAETSWNKQIDQMTITLDGKPAFVVFYGQGMGAGPIQVSLVRHWVILKGLTKEQKESVALGIYLDASHEFEKLQGSFPFSIKTGASSYSTEDLVSNVIGFYAAYREYSEPWLRETCGDVGVQESLRMWDEHLPNGLGGVQNKSAKPILFPTNAPSDAADPRFSSFFETIKPAATGALWVKPQSRFIDGYLVNARASIDVSATGKINVRRPTR